MRAKGVIVSLMVITLLPLHTALAGVTEYINKGVSWAKGTDSYKTITNSPAYNYMAGTAVGAYHVIKPYAARLMERPSLTDIMYNGLTGKGLVNSLIAQKGLSIQISKNAIGKLVGKYTHSDKGVISYLSNFSLLTPPIPYSAVYNNNTEIVTIDGEQYTVKYVPRDEIYPAFGHSCGDNTVMVRKDLPPPVKRFVKAHELYHARDKATWGG